MATAPARPFNAVRLVNIVAALVLLVSLELLIGPWTPFKPKPHAPQAQLRIPSGLPANYNEGLAAADRSITDSRDRLASHGDEWLAYDYLAQALLTRARLTGSFDDYAAVDAAFAKADALAPPGGGPDAREAVFNLTMHRIGRAEQSIDKLDRYAIRADAEQADALAMRGDIAMYRGDYAGAAHLYDRADRLAPGTTRYRRAILAANLGRFDDAADGFGRSERDARLPTRQMLATHELALGQVEMRRGDWDKAAGHFARADKFFPGYWLVEAHRAQAQALAGHPDLAIRQLEGIAGRTDAPEVMDALASLYRARGDGARSREWAARAGAGWTRRIEQFPEAAYGHAVEHELAVGDPAKALDLARRDFANRPHGATATALGWALLANNRPAEALRVIQPVLGSAWQLSDPHVVAAQAYTLLGQGEQARAEREKALAINPRSLDPASTIIWFGH